MEYSASSTDPGRTILTRSLRAGSPTLTLGVLRRINDAREARGLDRVMAPAGCRAARVAETLARAAAVLAESEAQDKRLRAAGLLGNASTRTPQGRGV